MALASQKRSTTSGPKNVTKTEVSPEDDSGTVKTLIINFARYYKGGISLNRFPIVPLEDQFRNITRLDSGGTDESEYFTKFLYAGSKRVVRVYLSHPAFDKVGTRGKGATLYNVAVRITPPPGATKRVDLVLLGNFEHRSKEDRWEYCVTGFYPEKSTGRYFGELEFQVKIVTIIRHPDDSFEEFDTDGRRSNRRVGVPGKSNFITEQVADRLCRSYTVPNHRSADANLSEWQAFLDHIEDIKGESGFPVDRPEFFHVYGVPEGQEADPKQVVFTDNGIVWTRQLFQNAPQRAVVKVTHRIDPAMSPSDVRGYVQQFNEMSRNLPMIVDPLVEKERMGTVIKKEEREEWSRLSRIGTIYDDVRRVSVLPEEDVKQLEQNRDAAVAQARESAGERLEASLEAAVIEYLSSGKGKSRAEQHMAAQSSRMDALREEARTEIAEERYGQAISENRDVSMQEIRAGITDKECNTAAKRAVMEELAAVVREELRPAVIERCDAETQQAIEAAEKKLRRKLEKLAKKKGTNILEAYYRLPTDPGMSIEQEIGLRNEHFGRLESFVLKDDEVQNRATVRRLNEALTVVRDGSMRNPYMMSFIYLPEFVPAPYPEKINHYFGTGFNEYQRQAISGAVGANGIFMIQGPPGTGKTQVIAEITAQEVVRGRKVLITSQGNKAVDNAFERISRYGFIRSLRIMSMSKESDYDISNLLPTFYGNIRESIRTRQEEFRDADFLARVRGDIARFNEGFVRYRQLEQSTRDRRNVKEKKAREAVTDLQRSLSTQKKKFENAYSEYYLILEKKERLAQFDLQELGERADEIRAMFPWIPAENADDMLFGPNGACRAIIAMTEEDAAELSQALQDPARSLEVSGWTVSRAFAKGDPAQIPAVRSRLTDILNVAESDLRSDMEQSEQRISELLSQDTDEVVSGEQDMDDSEIEDFLTVRESLLKLASSIFDDLHITESYDDVETAKAVIDDADAMISYFEADSDGKMFSDIDSFLAVEGVEKRDSDQILKGLSDNINVFGITCTANLYVDTSADGMGNRSDIIDLRRCGIDTVIIDEVSKVPFSELIRPIAFCRKVIMVGDHRQLPPVYIDEETDEELSRRFSELYSDSLFRDIFERVPEASRVMLRMQYRMARQIMEVVNMFYEEPLEMPDDVPDDWRAHRINIPGILKEDCSVLFVDVKGMEGHKSGSTSVYNAREAEAVAKMVRLLDENCNTDADGRPLGSPECRRMTMGVITPYRDQNLAIARELRMDPDDRSEYRLSLRQFQSDGEEGFKVKSVDDFQGDERDVILLSLVRTKSSSFISDFRRINVAMSRARRLLVIIGNADVLAQQEVDFGGARGKEKVYASIIGRVRQNGGFIDGAALIGEVQE